MRKGRRTVSLVTAPSTEPVTLDEVKTLARIDGTDDDALLSQLIGAATRTAEEYLRRSLITQTHKLTIDLSCHADNLPDGIYDLPETALYGGLPRAIELPKGPVQSITSVKTYDTSNTESTFASASYSVDTAGERLYLNLGYSWPTNLRPYAAVVINYVTGYGTATAVPQPIKTAIQMIVATLYENRGQCDDPNGIPVTAKALLDQYRIMGDRLG